MSQRAFQSIAKILLITGHDGDGQQYPAKTVDFPQLGRG